MSITPRYFAGIKTQKKVNMKSVKSNLAYVLLSFMGILTGIISCTHELPIPKDTGSGGTTTGGNGGTIQIATCSVDTVYFSNTILPLINSDCGKSGCHGTSNRNAFGMTTYSSIVSRLGTLSQLNNALQDMAETKAERPSLDYAPPSSDQMAQLQKWISQGARNNSCNSCDTTKFTYAAIIAPIINTYCKGCHTGSTASAGVDLSSYAATQAEITANPGRLVGSIQWTAPYTGTKQMPQGSGQLPSCYIIQIKKWIASGTPNN